MLGSRIPSTLKVLLLGLAIADDLGAIIIIALFYTEQVSLGWLAGAVVGLGAVVVMRRSRIWFTPLYAIIGVAVWLCTLQSGVHATIAGVALGLLTPARPLMSELDADHVTDHLSSDTDVTATEVRAVAFMIRESVSPAERFAHLLHPWTSYVIAPLFAFANAGIALSGEAIDQAIGSPVTAGVIIGLVGGKLVGITAFSWLAVRLGVAELPTGVTNRMIVGLAALAGVGFTVSMFITGLAYGDPDLQDQAKIGVLAGSAVGAVLGGLLLRSATAAKGSTTPESSGDELALLAPVHSAPQQ